VLGTAGADAGYGVAADGVGGVYVAGATEGSLDGNAAAGGADMILTHLCAP
jgi:hypothetical protein